MSNITTIINFCSNEYRFISHSIRAALTCTDHVIVPFSDHFFSGDPEHWQLINRCIEENPNATFIQLPFDITLREKKGPHFWHNVARWIGLQHCPNGTDFALFLDADEVLDPVRFTEWRAKTDLTPLNAVKFLNYWYFRDVCYQADQHEDSVVMTRVSAIKGKDVFSDSERHALKLAPYIEGAVGLDGQPFIHHYSWVRTQEEMLRKVKNWGHTSDRGNWEDLVNEEFSGPFSGTDFVHGYSFETVEPLITLDAPIDLSERDQSVAPKAFDNKIELSSEDFNALLAKRAGFFGRLFI
jgi:hypothetical protein